MDNILKITSRYYYTQLSERDKKVYKQIVTEIMNYHDSIRISGMYASDDIQRILEYVYLDYSHFFFLNLSSVAVETTMFSTQIKIRFSMSKEEIQILEQKIKDKIIEIISKRQEMIKGDEHTRVTSIYNYLVSNISYDFRPADTPHYAHTIVGPLLYGGGVCEGISKAFKLLCDVCNLHSLNVTGTAINVSSSAPENHMWNIVRINANCYHMDATWDCCSPVNCRGLQNYFCLNDTEIKVDHKSKYKVPICGAKSVHITFDENGTIDELKRFFKSHEKQITIKLDKSIDEKAFASLLKRTLNTSFCMINISYSFNIGLNTVTVIK